MAVPEQPHDAITASVKRPPGIRLPLVALLVGAWAIVPPYFALFGELTVKNSTIEFVDHAIPGMVVMAVAILGYLQLRAAQPSQLVLFVGGLVIMLAGFWMSATHVGLITQYRQTIVPFNRMAWHGVPGLAVVLLGVVWTACHWGGDDDGPERSASGH